MSRLKKSFPLSTIHYPLSTKIRKSKQHVVILGLFIVAFLAFAYSVSAAGLVPCGNTPDDLCTTCDFFQLFDNVKNFLLFKIVPPVGVLFVVIAGFFILTAGAKSDHYARGKKILTDLVWGLLIIFGAWMLTNTVIKLLASESDISGSWYKIECSATSGINPGGGGPTPTPGGGPTPTPPPASGNLCTGTPKPGANPCGNPSQCSQYSTPINQYANGIATASVLKSIIANESACNANAGSGAGACGLTQFLPSTARIYARNCGVSASVITCDWLKANPNKAICMTAAYLNSLAAGRCQNNIRHTIAAYNGGSKACRNSTSCAGVGCDGSARREWDCTAVANRYGETRTYVKRNLYCIQNPGF